MFSATEKRDNLLSVAWSTVNLMAPTAARVRR